MNPYLAKLRGLIPENHHLSEPSQPSKPSFEGFEGDQRSRLFRENAPVEIQQRHYRDILAALRSKCPELVESERWQQAIQDADSFLAQWGTKAHELGWTAGELFGLHPVPTQPAANYSRLSRRDAMGLIWLLQGRPVVALSEKKAAIQSAGASVIYYKDNEPALGPSATASTTWDRSHDDRERWDRCAAPPP